jgi:acetylornithine deacetylase/succinyl-diaminopimelate desuccinylase-like protein
VSLLETVLLWIDKNRSRWLADAKSWLSIPSISAQPDHAGDVAAAADWASDYLRTIGMQVEIVPTAKHPCLVATTPEGMAAKDAPHILIYGHYDVQPPEPLDLWTSPAFTPTVRGEQLFARGVSDDKGQVHCHLAALMAWREISQGFPCRITMIIEGEEEIGSPNLMKVVEAKKELLRTAQVLVVSDTSFFAPGVPSITYGLRGLIGLEFALHGAKTDLHSGSYGGTVANPAHAICEMIAKLHDAQGRITVPGFYEGVLAVTEEERRMWKTLPQDDRKHAEELGVEELFGEAGYSTLEREWARPTLEVNGLTSGYQGPGGKTVLPNRASAKITCRLVPSQDAEKIGDALEKHLRSLVPAGVRFELISRSTGSPPAITPIDSPAMAAAGDAVELAFGKRPVFQRAGGSIPVVAWFKQALGIDTVMLGYGMPDDCIHAPNEKMELANYYGGIKASAALYEFLAERLKGASTTKE